MFNFNENVEEEERIKEETLKGVETHKEIFIIPLSFHLFLQKQPIAYVVFYTIL